VLGVCGFAVAGSIQYGFGTTAALFSPFTAICMLIDPAGYSVDFRANGIFGGDSVLVGRIFLFIMTLIVSGGYCFLVWMMYKSMVKNFDMIIRRQHQ
jgi:hypothetical protein